MLAKVSSLLSTLFVSWLACTSLSLRKEKKMHTQNSQSFRVEYRQCSATTATNYPSLRDSPNGYQGHLRPCLSPPDRPPITEPDSNDVLTRSNLEVVAIGRKNAG
jgi:hypothetical protein